MRVFVIVVLIYLLIGCIDGIIFELSTRRKYHELLEEGEFVDNTLMYVLFWPANVCGYILGYIEGFFNL